VPQPETQLTTGDPVGAAEEASAAGVEHLTWGRYRQAQECFEEALACQQKVKDQKGIATGELRLGIALLMKGNYSAASLHLGRSLAICRELGDKEGQADALDQMGLLDSLQGQNLPARRHYRQAGELRAGGEG
jgi:tetratricopeptide (TPR) repeat protein